MRNRVWSTSLLEPLIENKAAVIIDVTNSISHCQLVTAMTVPSSLKIWKKRNAFRWKAWNIKNNYFTICTFRQCSPGLPQCLNELLYANICDYGNSCSAAIDYSKIIITAKLIKKVQIIFGVIIFGQNNFKLYWCPSIQLEHPIINDTDSF